MTASGEEDAVILSALMEDAKGDLIERVLMVFIGTVLFLMGNQVAQVSVGLISPSSNL